MKDISYIKRKDLNISKWDACIDGAENGLIYGYSFYLDAMCDNWDALVMGDYEAVMPLPWRKKWGFKYVYQPFLTPQLGIFGINIDKEVVKACLLSIPEKFKFCEINLNFGNDFVIQDFDMVRRPNYYLNLNKSYTEIKTKYRKNHIRNLNKAIQSDCRFEKNIPFDDVVKLAKVQLRQYTRLNNQDLQKFSALCRNLKNQNKAQTIGVFHNTKLLSGAIFFYHSNKVYYILAGNSIESKKIGASPFLIDSFIKNWAESDFTLDFVGSSILSIATFYKGFGAVKRFNTSVKLNKLPTPIKWLKK